MRAKIVYLLSHQLNANTSNNHRYIENSKQLLLYNKHQLFVPVFYTKPICFVDI